MKKYNYSDDFEDVCFQYSNSMEGLEYNYNTYQKNIINLVTLKLYHTLKVNFNRAGLYKEDIVSMANIYAMVYAKRHGFSNNPDKFKKLIDTKISKEQSDLNIIKKDNSNLVNFIRQRIRHLSIVCERKSRSISVKNNKIRFFAKTSSSIKADHEQIIENWKILGYRAILKKEYEVAYKLAKANRKDNIVDKDGFDIFKVTLYGQQMNAVDYRSLYLDSQINKYAHDPETLYGHSEELVNIESYKRKYEEMTPRYKRFKLNNFIKKNTGKTSYKEELRTARKMLKNLIGVKKNETSQ